MSNQNNKPYSIVETDAVHPLFNLPSKSVSVSTTSLLEYYCPQCKVYIQRTKRELRNHFVKKNHQPFTSCVYCKGPVYEYLKNNQDREFYHACQRNSDSHNDMTAQM